MSHFLLTPTDRGTALLKQGEFKRRANASAAGPARYAP